MEFEATMKYTVNLHNIRFMGEDPRVPNESEVAEFEEELSGEAYELAVELYLTHGLESATFGLRAQWLVDYTVRFEMAG